MKYEQNIFMPGFKSLTLCSAGLQSMFKNLILVHMTLRCCQWDQRYFRESGNSKYLTPESWVSGGDTALIYVESWY